MAGAVVGGTKVVPCALVVDWNSLAASNVVGSKVVSVKRNGQYFEKYFSIGWTSFIKWQRYYTKIRHPWDQNIGNKTILGVYSIK